MTINKELQIRAPSADERDEFYAVYVSGLPGVDEISPERFTAWWKRSKENGDLDTLWRVAVVEGKIVGVVINTINTELNWGFVWELAVLPEYRGRGIGTQLILESENLIQTHHPEIEELAIGVKTHNTRAISLYEKLDYGVRFLELYLRGKRWQPNSNNRIYSEPANTEMVDQLVEFDPDAYWSSRDIETWKEIIKPEHKFFLNEKGQLVGFARVIVQNEEPPYSEIQYNVKPGFGSSVLDACMKFVETDFVEVWVQDNHQDILDLLFRRGFKRVDSEFLLRKSLQKE